MTRLLSVVGLAWLYCTIGELQPIEYLKCVFLEILNVTTWSVFQNKVTYIIIISASLATLEHHANLCELWDAVGLHISTYHHDQ